MRDTLAASYRTTSAARDLVFSKVHVPMDSAGFGSPPAASLQVLAGLDACLDADVPAKKPGNLLIGTWNLRQFGRIT